jgi:hypothetical protein
MHRQTDMIAEIASAQMKHLQWKSNLTSAIAERRSDITPEKAACHKSCDFGKWFHGPSISAEVRSGPAWAAVNSAHAAFHATASEVLSLAITGRTEEAKTLLSGEFAARAEAVLKVLSLWKLEMKIGNGDI